MARKCLTVFCILSSMMSANLYAETHCRCLPNQECWPKASAWDSLQKQLTGQLIKPTSELSACKTDGNSKACKSEIESLHNPFQIENNAGDTQSQGWMNAWQSSASNYAVAATNADDVVAAVNFARKHHLRIVVKGTGHDYLGRSNAPNSLLIWTHQMRETHYDESFHPTGCNDQKGIPALTVSAGTRWLEAYDTAVNKNNRYVQGGGCTTVGAAGGFIQGGGFGSFSKMFGTGAAGIVQAEIVTADGKKLIANSCQNQDLFWAIRGGGASTYGIITKLTLKTHPLPQEFGLVHGTIKAKDDESFKALIKEIISFYSKHLNNEHWGEQIKFSADNSVTFSLTFVGLKESQAKETFAPLTAWVAQHKDNYQMDVNPVVIPANKLWNYDYISKAHPELTTLNKAPDALANQFWWTPNSKEVSMYWYTYQSWWLPIQLFEENAPLTKAIFAASRLSSVNLHFNKGMAGASQMAIDGVRQTATNPAVMNAAALLIMAAGTNTQYPGLKGMEPDQKKGKEMADTISQAMNYFIKLAPNAGTYVNEADYFTPNWQQSFWGEHYAKLLEIKKKYDPKGLFYCHHCVGSEDWSDDGMCRKIL